MTKLGREKAIREKTDKIARLAGLETPDQLLKRYIKTLDEVVQIVRQLRLEFSNQLEKWDNAKR